MARLLRMPIVYLAALLAAAVVGMASRHGGSGPRAAAPAVPSSPATGPPRAPADAAPTPEPGPTDPILRTPEGLRRKVLVRGLGVRCRSAPVGGVPTGPPLDYFSIHFVLEDPAGAARMRLADREGRPIGWAARDALLEWDTRLMARPTPRGGRPRLVLYREASCLLDALAGRACPRHGRDCPIEGEEPAEPGGEADGPSLGLPILQSRSIPEPDGSTRTVFEVASLVRDLAPLPPPDRPPPELAEKLRRVDVAFVIDTTASMQATIDAVRTLANRLVDDARAQNANATLRLALVEYRDDPKAFGFRARVVVDFAEPAAFRRALDTVRAADSGDGTVDEAVLDGLALALPGGGLSWPAGRDGELASKLVVLLGDSPDHAPDDAGARRLAERAREARITIAPVTIERPGYLKGAELARYRAQWRALAESSYRPPDPERNYAAPIEPALVDLGDQASAQIASRLRALVRARVAYALELAALAQAEAEGRLRRYTDSRGLTMEQVAPVLADLHRGEAAPRPRLDPRADGRVAPSIRRGWIAREQDGAALVEVELLMSRDELDAVIGELAALQQAAEGDAQDLADLLRIGNAAASGELSFLARDRGSRTVAEHLSRREGLPPAGPGSLLRRTQGELLRSDELFRAVLVERLRSSIAQLVRRRNAPDWDDPRRTADGMALVPYAPLDF
jgi:hypothetical protein